MVIHKLKEKDVISIEVVEKAFFELIWISDGYWQQHGKKTETRVIQKTNLIIDHVLEKYKLGSAFFYKEILTTER